MPGPINSSKSCPRGIGSLSDGEAVLDVDCGTGSLAAAFAQWTIVTRIVGIDPSAGFMLWHSAALMNIQTKRTRDRLRVCVIRRLLAPARCGGAYGGVPPNGDRRTTKPHKERLRQTIFGSRKMSRLP